MSDIAKSSMKYILQNIQPIDQIVVLKNSYDIPADILDLPFICTRYLIIEKLNAALTHINHPVDTAQ